MPILRLSEQDSGKSTLDWSLVCGVLTLTAYGTTETIWTFLITSCMLPSTPYMAEMTSFNPSGAGRYLETGECIQKQVAEAVPIHIWRGGAAGLMKQPCRNS